MILIFNDEFIVLPKDVEINPFEDLELPWNEFYLSGEEFFSILKQQLKSSKIYPYIVNNGENIEFVYFNDLNMLQIITDEYLNIQMIQDTLLVIENTTVKIVEFVQFKYINNKCILSFIDSLLNLG